MIKSASEMKKVAESREIYEKGYKQAVEAVMRDVERASNEGRRRTCFNPPAYWYETSSGIRTFVKFYDEVKAEFMKHGYTFSPTGYRGGVWQRTEDICW